MKLNRSVPSGCKNREGGWQTVCNKRSNGRFQKISIPIPRTAFRISEGEGGSLNWNLEGMGGIYKWKSEGNEEFHRWDFWSRKNRVSSLKTLFLCTSVVSK